MLGNLVVRREKGVKTWVLISIVLHHSVLHLHVDININIHCKSTNPSRPIHVFIFLSLPPSDFQDLRNQPMLPKQEKEPVNLVEIDSSDDEDGFGVGRSNNSSSINEPTIPQVETAAVNPPLASGNQTLESRSFWKAGDFTVGPTKFTPAQGCLWFHHFMVHLSHTCMYRTPIHVCMHSLSNVS